MKNTFGSPAKLVTHPLQTLLSTARLARAPGQGFRSAVRRIYIRQAPLLALALATGVGCVGFQRHPDPGFVSIQRVIALAQPTEQAAPHRLQRLHAAFVRDDGTILLQIHGKPVNAAKSQPCTLEIPPPKPSSQTDVVARRVEVPNSALRLGWDTNAVTSTNAHPLPIGPVMTLPAKEVYNWDRLTLTEGQTEEIRLVHRPDSVTPWEILHLRAHPTPTQASFTIYEVRPTMIPKDNRVALGLMPFALAEEVLTRVGTPVGNAGAIFIYMLAAGGR